MEVPHVTCVAVFTTSVLVIKVYCSAEYWIVIVGNNFPVNPCSIYIGALLLFMVFSLRHQPHSCTRHPAGSGYSIPTD